MASRCCCYVLVSLMFASSLVALVVSLVENRMRLSTLFYVHGSCAVRQSLYTVQYRCDCGRGCKSTYPCIVVYAALNDSRVEPHLGDWPVMLFDDDVQQVKVLEETNTLLEERCSMRTCRQLTQHNRDQVERFRLRSGLPGVTLDCFYDPKRVQQDGAVLRRQVSVFVLLHVLLLPMLGAMISVCACAVLGVLRARDRKRYRLQKRMLRQAGNPKF